MSLHHQEKELMDVGQLLYRLFIQHLFERKDYMALTELLPTPRGSSPVKSFCQGCVLKVSD